MTTLTCMLRPPRGCDVRRLVALLTLAVAVPRLPFWPGPPVVYPLRLLPQEVFGWLTLFIGLTLLLTACNRWRLHPVGRLIAVLGFATWLTLAAATTSVTSMIVDVAIAYALLGEILSLRHDC